MRLLHVLSVLVLLVATPSHGNSVALDPHQRPAVTAEKGTPKSDARDTSAPLITLEFEPPPEFYEHGSDGRAVVVGFRVGYFRAPSSDARAKRQSGPVRMIYFPRDDVKVDGKVARVSFRPEPMRADSTEIVFRVQAMRDGAEGFWSEPTPPMTLPKAERAAPARVTANLEEEVAKHPALSEAVRTLEAKSKRAASPEVNNSSWVKAFRRVEDLALAVVICRDHAVPCETLAARIVGPPRQSLQRALREWQDAQAIPKLVRSARAESRKLLSAPARPK